jgi:hypothetical protein
LSRSWHSSPSLLGSPAGRSPAGLRAAITVSHRGCRLLGRCRAMGVLYVKEGFPPLSKHELNFDMGPVVPFTAVPPRSLANLNPIFEPMQCNNAASSTTLSSRGAAELLSSSISICCSSAYLLLRLDKDCCRSCLEHRELNMILLAVSWWQSQSQSQLHATDSNSSLAGVFCQRIWGAFQDAMPLLWSAIGLEYISTPSWVQV